MDKLKHNRRTAFTFTEIAVTLAVIGVLGVVIMQCLVVSVRERAQLAAHQAAVELAANILEAARAQPWDKLDKNWAATQAVPADAETLLPEGKVLVTLDVEGASPSTKRVTVEVRWQFDSQLPPQSVQLTSVFSAREAKTAGGQP